ncbi:MAG TPA: T9SS type A sorting domain-containing protein, partial [Flavobacteriales bacterium]|nr:T9SS type A sorting domain-containing protein [Flavobacteriales bacterium]
ILDAGEHAAYLWSDGSTDRYLTVLSSGDRFVTVQNAFGVSARSDTVAVVAEPLPLIASTTQNPLCAAGSTGSISLTNLNGVPAQSVQWNTGDEGVLLTDLAAGTYTFLFTDVNGCATSGTLDLTEPPELFVQATTTPAVLGNDGSIEIAVFGGVPPYVITLNGSIAGAINTDLVPGPYDLVVTDAHGCTHEETLMVDSPLGITSSSDDAFRLFPNPAQDHVFFTCTVPVRRLVVMDPGGRVVSTIASNNSGPLDVRALAPGHYLLCATMQDGSVVRRPFIKINDQE